MDVVRDREWKKPLPQHDPVYAPFWEAAERGRLLYQECPTCGNRQFYPRALCTACGADPAWVEAAGRGVVHTYTIVRQYGAPPFRDELPYVVAVIELDEGVRMLGNVTDCAVDAVYVGMPVEAYAVKASERVGVPFWRPGKRPQVSRSEPKASEDQRVGARSEASRPARSEAQPSEVRTGGNR